MRRPVRAILAAAAVVALVVGLWRLDLWGHVTVESMRALVDAWEPLGPLVFIAVFIAGFFIPGPEIVLVALGGVLFGAMWGFVYSWIASFLGTALVFLLVRYTAQAWVQRALRDRLPRLRALDDRLERHGLVTVIVLRLSLFLAPPLNWALGASRVRTADYVLGTALGIVPGIGLTVYLSDRVTDAGSTTELLTVEILGPAIVLAILLVSGAALGQQLLRGSAGRRRDPGGQANRRAASERSGEHSGIDVRDHRARRARRTQAEEPRQRIH
jgi:phospholipase D1/2